ncbi:hypothetical protein ACFUTR_23490 [Streptomyces sp. NPDC057367]|uniref:hypothetical protein n=1 Tax=Streptomyces sp. NPDC057367 TaxID=3346108 RepID=UPI003626C350
MTDQTTDQTAPLREQLLDALDFSYCQGLGYATPEELLAAYDASRAPGDWDALVREADQLRRDGAALHARAEGIDRQLAALRQQVAAPVDRAAVLREAADKLMALRPCDECYPGRHDAADHLRRMADETATTETQAAPVQHAPGKAIRCPDCRDKGYTVCLDGPAAGARQDGASS